MFYTYNALYIVSLHYYDRLSFYSVQSNNMYSRLEKLFETEILNMIFLVNKRTATQCPFKVHYYHPFYLLQIFTFSIQIMFSLISSDANSPQVLMRRKAPNKQTKLSMFV